MLARLVPPLDRVAAARPIGPAEPGSAENPAHQPPTNDRSSPVGQSLAQLLKRPQISIEHLMPVLCDLAPGFFPAVGEVGPKGSPLSSQARNELKSVETEIKYAGYLHQQQRSIDRLKKAERRSIPDWFDYRTVSGLSREMQEKLLKIRPRTLGHASRIPGVTPAAVSLVNVYIEIQARRREQAAAL
jgi:tRNA uridine 5-carboxymethylaminomethyl modification enzyme